MVEYAAVMNTMDYNIEDLTVSGTANFLPGCKLINFPCDDFTLQINGDGQLYVGDGSISVSKIIGTDLWFRLLADEANITLLLGRTQNQNATAGSTTFTGALSATGTLSVPAITLGGVDLDGRISTIETKTQYLSTSAGVTYLSSDFTPTVNTKSLGSTLVPWSRLYALGITLNGVDLDTRIGALETKTLYQSTASGQTSFSSTLNAPIFYLNGVNLDTRIGTIETKTQYQSAAANVTTFTGTLAVPAITLNGVSLNTRISAIETKTQYQSAAANVTTFTGTLAVPAITLNGTDLNTRISAVEATATTLTNKTAWYTTSAGVVTSTSSVVPSGASLYDLGTATQTWNNGYFQTLSGSSAVNTPVVNTSFIFASGALQTSAAGNMTFITTASGTMNFTSASTITLQTSVTTANILLKNGTTTMLTVSTSGVTIPTLITTNSTMTNATCTSLVTTSATCTNLVCTTATCTTVNTTNSTCTNLTVTTATCTNLTVTTATCTTVNTTNLTATGTITAPTYASTGSMNINSGGTLTINASAHSFQVSGVSKFSLASSSSVLQLPLTIPLSVGSGYYFGGASTTTATNSFYSGVQDPTTTQNEFVFQIEGSAKTTLNTTMNFVGQHKWEVRATLDGGFDFVDRTAGANRLKIQSDGKVGIGTTSPDQLLTVNSSSVSKVTAGSWIAISDERVKTNIKPWKTGLEAIMKINPVTYQFNEDSGYDKDILGQTFVGLIAQNAESAIPETVTKGKRGKFTDLRSFDPTNLTYALINAVQDLANQVASLQKQLANTKLADVPVDEDLQNPKRTKFT